MNQASAALLGAFIGASAGVTGGVVLEWYKRRRDRQGTASAVAGEIASILYMTERRNHPAFFERMLPKLDAGEDVPVPAIAPGDDQRDLVADRYLDRLGLLPSDYAERVIRFYTLVVGFRADVRRMTSGEFKGKPSVMASIIREDLEVWREATQLGHQLVTELGKVATPFRWKWTKHARRGRGPG